MDKFQEEEREKKRGWERKKIRHAKPEYINRGREEKSRGKLERERRLWCKIQEDGGREGEREVVASCNDRATLNCLTSSV